MNYFSTTVHVLKLSVEILLKDWFYNCLCSKVVCGDFTKRLVKSITICEMKRQKTGLSEQYTLQLYKWHMVKAIKQHFVIAGIYLKEQHDKVIDLI